MTWTPLDSPVLLPWKRTGRHLGGSDPARLRVRVGVWFSSVPRSYNLFVCYHAQISSRRVTGGVAESWAMCYC